QGKPIARRKKAAAESLRRSEHFLGLTMTRPAKAALFSAIVPGAGQVYNRKYWKVPVFGGAIGGLVAADVYYQRLFREFKQATLARGDNDPATQDRGKHSATMSDQSVDFYLNRFRTRRDQFFGYTLMAYGLGILDAIVDAHLRDFDVDDNLAWRCSPNLIQMNSVTAPGLSVVIDLPSYSLSKR
ncbi:MAG TPA: DUF5683 domain-containing protein, partial [Hymenobacter sp.]